MTAGTVVTVAVAGLAVAEVAMVTWSAAAMTETALSMAAAAALYTAGERAPALAAWGVAVGATSVLA